MITKANATGAPILVDPFTHEETDEYYEQMYKHVVSDGKPPLDLATLTAVHDFLEFESTSIMMIDAWLHAHLQKANGKSYIPKTS